MVLVYPSDSYGRGIISSRTFEPYMQVVLRAITPEGGIVLDIGANYGITTLTFAKAAGSEGTVYAIEPSPPVYELLTKSILLNAYQDIIYPHNLAIVNGTTRYIYFKVIENESYASYISKSKTDVKVKGTQVDDFLL